MAGASRWAQQRWGLLVLVAVLLAVLVVRSVAVAEREQSAVKAGAFPAELVEWTPHQANPVFTAGGPGHWDVTIRERGWIQREAGTYHMWFTGYDGTREGIKLLGYATSPDGIHWERWPDNPIYRDHWVEDMMVVKHGGVYFMFAEGAEQNHAVMLTSEDRVHWQWEGPLEVRLADGRRMVDEPCGTPTVWIENDTWYLFYERFDRGIWLATTDDPRERIWTNVQDEPVLVPGPAEHDSQMIALNQVIKHQGAYFAFYHGSGDAERPRKWNTNIARSTDLIRWEKYADNPIVPGDRSSGIVVHDGRRFRLYTMHAEVDLFFSRPN